MIRWLIGLVACAALLGCQQQGAPVDPFGRRTVPPPATGAIMPGAATGVPTPAATVGGPGVGAAPGSPYMTTPPFTPGPTYSAPPTNVPYPSSGPASGSPYAPANGPTPAPTPVPGSSPYSPPGGFDYRGGGAAPGPTGPTTSIPAGSPATAWTSRTSTTTVIPPPSPSIIQIPVSEGAFRSVQNEQPAGLPTDRTPIVRTLQPRSREQATRPTLAAMGTTGVSPAPLTSEGTIPLRDIMDLPPAPESPATVSSVASEPADRVR